MFVRTTACQAGWPLAYRTYHQETQPPYRHGRVCVLRFGRKGLVLGRWTHHDLSEYAAHAAALGARPLPLLDERGDLLEQYQTADTGDEQ